MVRLSCFLSLALAAQGLHAAPTVSRDQGGDLQTRDISASEQITDILARQESNRDDDVDLESPQQGYQPRAVQRATERPGGKTAAEGQADRIAKAPAPNNGGFPTAKQEERTQLTNAQKTGSRGSTKFKDTPQGAAAAAKSKNTPTERPGGKTAAEGQADRIAKAPAPNNRGFPTAEQEERTQLTNAQKTGSRGSTKFKDTPQGAAAAAKSKNTPTERPGGKTAAEGQADRIAKGGR